MHSNLVQLNYFSFAFKSDANIQNRERLEEFFSFKKKTLNRLLYSKSFLNIDDFLHQAAINLSLNADFYDNYDARYIVIKYCGHHKNQRLKNSVS